MKIKIFIIAFLALVVGVLSQDLIVDKYYSILNKSEVRCVKQVLSSINQNDITAAEKVVRVGSKLLEPTIFPVASLNVHKVDLDTMKISDISTFESGGKETTKVQVFFNSNNEAWIELLLLGDSEKNGWKVRDIIFNDAFFLD